MANWDEDSITMAVEASRDCLTSHKAEDVRSLYFASTTHPFKDRQNAGVIGTALSIEQNLLASDVGGSLKAGTSALIAGLNASKNGGGPALVAAADKRMARVASSNELNYGDGAAALLCGTENVIAKLVGHHSVSMDFVDHFRGDETDFDYGWEERWIRDEGYSKIVPPADQGGTRRLQAQGQRHHPVHHAEPDAGRPQADGQGLRHRRGRGARPFRRQRSATPARRTRWSCWSMRWRPPRQATRSWSWPSARASTSLVFEVTAENAKLPKRKGLSGWMARRKEEKNYMKFLAFNEMLPIEKGMRAEFDKKTALSVLWRKRDMIYGLVGGKCKVCGTVQFPRSQVCVNPNCHAIDSQEPYAMAGLEAERDVVHRRLAHLLAGSAGLLRHDHLPRGRPLHGRLHRQRQGTGQGRHQDAHDLPHPRQRHHARRLQALLLEGGAGLIDTTVTPSAARGLYGTSKGPSGSALGMTARLSEA